MHTTNSYKETQKLGKELAEKILKAGLQNKAVVLGLYGNLGGGKTTFLQGFAKGLGIKEKILSPTFVVMKKFKLNPSAQRLTHDTYYHIDCYRLEGNEAILSPDFKNIIKDPKNIVAIEWPEKIKKALPKGIIKISFNFIDKNKREVSF